MHVWKMPKLYARLDIYFLGIGSEQDPDLCSVNSSTCAPSSIESLLFVLARLGTISW